MGGRKRHSFRGTKRNEWELAGFFEQFVGQACSLPALALKGILH